MMRNNSNVMQRHNEKGGKKPDAVLSVRHLNVSVNSAKGVLPIVRDVSLDVYRGKTLALVGESGCGKTMAMQALMGLLPASQGAQIAGSVTLKPEGKPDVALLSLSEKQMNRYRGNQLAMVFQEPMTALNPTMTIGAQIAEPLRIHKGMSRKAAMMRAVQLLAETGIDEPQRRVRQYPFEFSGGMLQRVMIAMALACEPSVIIADEPTTALDVTTQQQVLTLFKQLQQRHGTALVLITHDLAVVADLADQVAVMYAGEIVEYGDRSAVFADRIHPYTAALRASTPALQHRGEPLVVLEGQPPPIGLEHSGCPFANRCPLAMNICLRRSVPVFDVVESEQGIQETSHQVKCWRYAQQDLQPHESEGADRQ